MRSIQVGSRHTVQNVQMRSARVTGKYECLLGSLKCPLVAFHAFDGIRETIPADAAEGVTSRTPPIIQRPLSHPSRLAAPLGRMAKCIYQYPRYNHTSATQHNLTWYP